MIRTKGTLEYSNPGTSFERARGPLEVFLIVGLLILGLFAENSQADLKSCLSAATTATLDCEIGAERARIQSDYEALSATQAVSEKSLKGSADSEAAVTARIRNILEGARQTCERAINDCKNACPGEFAGFADACGEELGDYQNELTQARDENSRGQSGSDLSSARARGTHGNAPSPQSATPPPAAPPTKYQDRKPTTQMPQSLSREQSRMIYREFCAETGNSMCPACTGTSLEQIRASSQAELSSLCTATCVKDPELGPDLAALCRPVVSRRGCRTNEKGNGC